jgi:hypothetical protein
VFLEDYLKTSFDQRAVFVSPDAGGVERRGPTRSGSVRPWPSSTSVAPGPTRARSCT